MRPFENRTADGNENAVKRGKVVPSDAVNLAWVKSPKMTPSKNVVIVDTAQIVEENTIKDTGARKIYYANSLGILEDRFGNQLVEDEYPLVSDVFLKEEDFSTVPAEEYEDSDVLPFVHISRFFHADHPGLTLHNDLVTYNTSKIKVVDDKGREYLDDSGAPRYKVKIFTAYASEVTDHNAYRLHIFLDSDLDENLYVTYNKIELDADGHFMHPDPGYKELLNPQPFFEYRPEESEVVDPANRDKRIFSTRPTSLKEQVLGLPVAAKEGYKVYVPKKAIGDPRIYQTFRWRVTCSFIQQYKVDPSSPAGIRCGVVVTDGKHSPTPYAFLNLSRSQYNVSGMKFYNPLRAADDETSQNSREYWEVDFDTVSYSDLKQFDILLWSPQPGVISDINKYAGKIDYFTKQVGGTMMFDTNAQAWIRGFGVRMTPPVSPSLGSPVIRSTAPEDVRGYGYTKIRETDLHHELFEGALKYGGWNFNDDPRLTEKTWEDVSWHSRVIDEFDTLTIHSSIMDKYGATLTHYFKALPTGWEPIYKIQAPYGVPHQGKYYPAIICRTLRNVPAIVRTNWQEGWEDQFKPNYQGAGNPAGHIVMTTLGIAESVNVLTHHIEKNVVDYNKGATLAAYDDYRLYINASWTEGAYKFLYNLCLVALKNKPLDSSDEKTFSTTFSVSSPWKSSWVVDGEVLSESERSKNAFALLPTDEATPTPVWQRKLSNRRLKEIINDAIPTDMKAKVDGAKRVYEIEVTNSTVLTPEQVDGESRPYAWTMEYSPNFIVPVELGPHVIRDEEIKAHYEAGQYIHKSYPAKPYNGRVVVESVFTEEFDTIEPVHWTVHGIANETITTGVFVPPSKTTKESEVDLNWKDNGAGGFTTSGRPWEEGMRVPNGIDTWNNWNYYSSAWGRGHENWANPGMYFELKLGARGEAVTFVQDALNVFQFFGIFHASELALDGNYGARTRAAVINFQEQMGCSRVTGIVDAETFSIIGSQIIRLGDLIYKNRSNSGWSRFYFWPRTSILRQNMSDGRKDTYYAKRTWMRDGPDIAWDMAMVVFDDVYDLIGVSFTPWVAGDTPTVMFRSIDVRKQPFNLANYDSRAGNPIYMPHRPRDGQTIYVPFNKRRGDTVVVGFGQDGGSGWGTSRVFGVRDITARARVLTTTVNPGIDTIKKQTRDRAVTYSGVSYISGEKKFKIPFPVPAANGKINSVKWNSVTTDNPSIQTQLVDAIGGTYLYLANYQKDATSQSRSAYGPWFPKDHLGTEKPPYYYMNPDSKRVSRVRETGWISKADGVKVLCNKNGQPVGFPNSIPSTAAAPDEAQTHFTNLFIESAGNDASVQVGFYDISKKEFITSVQGKPEMPFIEYLTRGRNNVYVAVVSTYEVDTTLPLPDDDDAPLIPYKWAMPVYGLYKRTGSKIGLGRLPENLGVDDLWAVPIKTGKFDKQIYIRPAAQGAHVDWTQKYQGQTLTAHYDIPESSDAERSQIWGAPYADIIGETPQILDDDLLRVNQAPILMRVVPTPNPSLADPARPVFRVFHRDTVEDAWEELPMSAIKDYNVSTGEIYLVDPMDSSDPDLWRVDYTTDRKVFMFKGTSDYIVNLNPYSVFSKPLLKKPTYIYIVPEYVRDKSAVVIPESYNEVTIRTTQDPALFDPLSPIYEPLAVQLGVVYLSTALDIDELAIIDSRKRGGGAPAELALEEIKMIAQDAANFWDMDVDFAPSYQNAGFVVIRLPEELKDRFTEGEIRAVIERNITAGVKFKIEDLSGKDWS